MIHADRLSLILSAVLAGLLGLHPIHADYYVERVFVDDKEHSVAVFPPQDAQTPSPAILFLHGSGERGDDLDLATREGVPELRRLLPGAFIIVPQVGSEDWWTDSQSQALAMASLRQAGERYKLDPARVYLTGISMGGEGALALAANQPDVFSSVVVVCASIGLDRELPEESKLNSLAEALAARLAGTRIWLFHGDTDKAVPVEHARALHTALSANNDRTRYTELPHSGHNIWKKVYSKAELGEWLARQSDHDE